MAHLTFSHRQQIAEGIRAGKSNARIAREIAVHPSTVGREIGRNAGTREQYAARYAHTMAACRQIRAARDRFICAAEVYVPTNYRPNRSPFSALTLPPLYYVRPMYIGGDSGLFFHDTYYYKGNYPAFARFDQVPAFFKSSGRSVLPSPRIISNPGRNAVLSGQSFFENMGRTTDIFKRGNDMVTSSGRFFVADQTAYCSLSMSFKRNAFSRRERAVFHQNIASVFRPKYYNFKKPLLTKGKSLALFSKAGEKLIFSSNSYLHSFVTPKFFFQKSFKERGIAF